MPPMNLRWKVWGRPVKPVAFSLMVTMIILFVINIIDLGILQDHSGGDVLAGLALATGALLTVAWVKRSQMLAEVGLLAAFFVWAIRFFLGLFITPSPFESEGIYLSLCWAMVAGGSYLLEKADSLTVTRGF